MAERINFAFNYYTGAAVFDRLQQLDESSNPAMKEELDTLLIGVVVAFMFGWFGPVRPGALISLCHPGYEVRQSASSSSHDFVGSYPIKKIQWC